MKQTTVIVLLVVAAIGGMSFGHFWACSAGQTETNSSDYRRANDPKDFWGGNKSHEIPKGQEMRPRW